jgi:N4-gp56 family major capsid protein
MSPTTYGDISPRTAAYAVKPLLKRGHENMILEKFGQTYVVPMNSTTTAKFRRYELLPLATTPLVEGVTPQGSKPTYTDITVNLLQFGDFIMLTDVVEDTHEDPIIKEFGDLLMQQWTETIETLRWGIVRGGTNVFYANGTARNQVNTVITRAAQMKVTQALLAQRAKLITSYVSSNPNFNKESIEGAFVAVANVYVENDIRAMQNFIPTKNYANGGTWANEIGAVDNVRYIRSVLFTGFPDAGGAKLTMRSTSGTNADVYPVIYFAQDAFGIVPLKGSQAVQLIVHNRGSSGSADPLNQKGSMGWKTMQNAVILNDLWIARLEVAVTA